VHTNEGIQKVEVEPATRSAVATCKYKYIYAVAHCGLILS